MSIYKTHLKGGVMLRGNCGSMRYSAFVYEREEHISEIAHYRWLLRGCPEGSPEVDWFAAEQEFDQAFVRQLELGMLA